MALLEFCAEAFIKWCVVSAIVGGAYAVVMARHKRRRADVVRRPVYPPPVPHPPLKQADLDATWLICWPSAVGDADDVNRRFTSLISSTWHWPEDAL
jgi:hypothetical protein